MNIGEIKSTQDAQVEAIKAGVKDAHVVLERVATEVAKAVRADAARRGHSVGIRVVRRPAGVRVTVSGPRASQYRSVVERALEAKVPNAAVEIRSQLTPEGQVTNAPINRPALSKAIFDHLAATVDGVLFGRGVAPPAGGWPGGKDRDGSPWVPYAVLRAGTAVTPAPGFPERIGRDRTSWQCNYQLTSHHVAASKADDVAQLVRAAVVEIDGTLTLGGVDWVVQEVTVPQIGGTEKDESTDPDHWRVTDAVSVRLSRASAR